MWTTIGKARNGRIGIYTKSTGDADGSHRFWTKECQQGPNIYKSAACFMEKAAVNLSIHVNQAIDNQTFGFLHTYITEMNISFPTVVVTWCNLALINALAIVFSLAFYLICVWHVNKDVLVYYKLLFETRKTWDEFYAVWQMVMYANTSDSTWIKFQDNYTIKYLDVVNYLNNS